MHGRVRSRIYSGNESSLRNSPQDKKSAGKQRRSRRSKGCREMPPIRRPLREIPRAENPRQAWIIDGTDVVLGPMVASRAGEDAPVAKTKEAIAGAGFRLAPLTALVSIVHSTIKGWFTRMDTALEVLPAGLGPIVASLVRTIAQ